MPAINLAPSGGNEDRLQRKNSPRSEPLEDACDVMNVDALLSPPEIDLLSQRDLSETVCVVFDVLRATTSIITGLANGVEAIRPVSTIEEALRSRELWPEALLGGERHGEKISGFDLGNSPAEYCALGSKTVITTTTNGTVALRACDKAKQVLVGALVNIGALAVWLNEHRPEQLLLVCAGTNRTMSLEDVVAAGMLAKHLSGITRSDAVEATIALYEKHAHDLYGALSQSSNGRLLISRNRQPDVEWCAEASRFPLIGEMRDGVIRVLPT